MRRIPPAHTPLAQWTPSSHRTAGRPGPERVSVRPAVAEPLPIMARLCNSQSRPRCKRRREAHEAEFRGRCKWSSQSIARCACLWPQVPCCLHTRPAARARRRTKSAMASSGVGLKSKMWPTIRLCNLSNLSRVRVDGGHRVTRKSNGCRTARLSNAKRRGWVIARPDAQAMLPKRLATFPSARLASIL